MTAFSLPALTLATSCPRDADVVVSHLGDPEATRLAEELHHLHQEPQEVLLPLLESLENRVERLHAHFRARGWLGEEGE